MSAHILIVEDDPKQAELIRVSGRGPPDPPGDSDAGADGLSVCRWLRQRGDTPVLMLTARSTEEDLLAGLDVGADDYMTKPYSPRGVAVYSR